MIKLAVIGAGNICHKHLDVIKTIKKFKILSIASKTKSRALDVAKKYKINKVYSSIDKMLIHENPDAVAVFVNAENMYQVLKKIIKYKIPFFFEKPAALNYRQTKELHFLANKYKVKNMIGLNRRFYSIFKKGINYLKKRGGIKGILIEGHERIWKISRSTNKKVYKSWLFANSVHTIDLLRFFGGEVKLFKSFNNNKKNFKNFTISLKFKNNTIGTYVSNWHSPGGWSVTLYGNLFTVIFKPLENGIIINHNFKSKKIIEDKFDNKYKPGFYYQMKCFQNLVLTGKLNYPGQSLKDFNKTVELINRI